jgi:hypothetical protein
MPLGAASGNNTSSHLASREGQRDEETAWESSVHYDNAIIRLPRAIQVAVVPPSDACRQFLAWPGTPASMRRWFPERTTFATRVPPRGSLVAAQISSSAATYLD